LKKEVLKVGRAAANAPYSPVVRAGDLLFVSGQVALDGEGKLLEGDFEAQCRKCLAQLKNLLVEAGASLSHVVKTTVFLQDLANFARLNDLYREAFPTDRPARTCIQIAALPLGAAVEIEAIAVAP
jgi:2-iminobutanoate/2-iminopropanoate deaminase